MPLERFVMPRRAFADERTGREVWQLTDGDFECVPPYMDTPAWSGDDRYLVFMCNRSGSWQPYRLEPATGEATQLCEVTGAGSFSVAVDRVGNEAYCADGRRFVAVNIQTLEKRPAADLGAYLDESAGRGRRPVINRDGTLLVIACRRTDGPSCLLIARTDDSGQVQVLTLPRDDVLPGHEQFCPADDDLISFCNNDDHQDDPNETPPRRAREWRIRRDTGEMRPLVLMPPGFRGTHGYWGRSGRRFYFHRKTVPGWVPTALCSVDGQGEDLRVYYETSAHRLGHSSASPNEQWIVTDSQDPDENILMLVHLRRNCQHLLCWPSNSIGSGRPDRRRPELPPHRHRHTHPHFSSTGRYVSYASDATGRTQVYVVDVGDIVAGG